MTKTQKPLLNSFNESQIASMCADPPHAILVIGDQTGLSVATSEYIASELLRLNNLAKGELYVVGALEEVPSIDDIRQIKSVTRSKNVRNGTSRIVLIGNVSKIKPEGQNALLKMIEEPVAGTVYILAADVSNAVLRTIKSRCSELILRRPGVAEALAHYRGAYTEDQLRNALSACQNLTNLDRYLGGNHTSMSDAKAVFSKSPFERLALISELSKDRSKAQDLVANLQVISRFLYKKSIKTNNTNDARKYHDSLMINLEVSDALARNGNVKLNLIRMFTSM